MSQEFGIQQIQIHRWLKRLKESAADVFSGESTAEKDAMKEKELHNLHAKINQWAVERDF